jgi:hypothetical protein
MMSVTTAAASLQAILVYGTCRLMSIDQGYITFNSQEPPPLAVVLCCHALHDHRPEVRKTADTYVWTAAATSTAAADCVMALCSVCRQLHIAALNTGCTAALLHMCFMYLTALQLSQQVWHCPDVPAA